MSKSVMISGPHGIGKTTTAKEIALKFGYLFIGSVASIVAKKVGFDINKDFNPVDISKYQYEIVKGLEFVYDATALVDTISDRSPLDSAVYLTLALENEPGFESVIEEYRNLCIELTNNNCNVLVLPEADFTIPYEDKHGRPTYTNHQIEYRNRYTAELNSLVAVISPSIKVIRVPIEKQYSARNEFIMNELYKIGASNHD